MPDFDSNAIRKQPRIWSLFRDGPVLLFHRQERLDSVCSELHQAGYRIVDATCEGADRGDQLLGRLLQSLGIVRTVQPTNRDAFNDLLYDLDASPAEGIVIVLRGFHHLQQADSEFALDVVDILAQHHRISLLTGTRLLILIETCGSSDEPWQRPVGGSIPLWLDEPPSS